jgi:hypothetical protein
MNDSWIRVHLPGALLLFALLLGLLFYLVLPPDRRAQTLFFPGATSSELTGEQRLVPRVHTRERQVGLLVEELILGPARIDHSRIFPRSTDVKSAILVDSTVYIDLSADVIQHSDAVSVPLETALLALERTVMFNYRDAEEVVVTIEGNVPFVPAYRDIGR